MHNLFSNVTLCHWFSKKCVSYETAKSLTNDSFNRKSKHLFPVCMFLITFLNVSFCICYLKKTDAIIWKIFFEWRYYDLMIYKIIYYLNEYFKRMWSIPLLWNAISAINYVICMFLHWSWSGRQPESSQNAYNGQLFKTRAGCAIQFPYAGTGTQLQESFLLPPGVYTTSKVEAGTVGGYGTQELWYET